MFSVIEHVGTIQSGDTMTIEQQPTAFAGDDAPTQAFRVPQPRHAQPSAMPQMPQAPGMWQGQPRQGQQQPSKKRRRWPWVLGAFIALIVIISAANSGNTTTPTTSPSTAAPAAQSAPAATASYTYKVTGSGSATVMYTGKGGQMSQSTQKLPWSKTVDRDQFLSFGMVSATVMNAKGPISCTITDETGKVVGQNTADGGDFATVSCNSNGS